MSTPILIFMSKVLSIAAALASVLIIFGLIRQIGNALDAGERFDQVAHDVGSLQEENGKLIKQSEEIQKYEFIENVARDKLNMSKSNETVVIIPEEDIQRMLDAQKPTPEPKLANWQGWLKLFFR